MALVLLQLFWKLLCLLWPRKVTTKRIKRIATGVHKDTFKFKWQINNFDDIIRNEMLIAKQRMYVHCRGEEPETDTEFLIYLLPETSIYFPDLKERYANVYYKMIKTSCVGNMYTSIEIQIGNSFDIDGFYFVGESSITRTALNKSMPMYGVAEVLPIRKSIINKMTDSDLVINITMNVFVEMISETLHVSSGPVALEEPRHERERLRNFIELYKFEDMDHLSDVIIYSRTGKAFKSFKLLLSAQSEVFKRMLMNGFREAAASKIELYDVSDEILEILMHYLHSGNFEEKNIKDFDALVELINLCEQYELDILNIHCDLLLYDLLCTENLSRTQELVKMFSLPMTKSKVEKFDRIIEGL